MNDESEHQEWILCPKCGNKTRLKLRKDTVLTNFPLLGMFGTVMGLLNVDFSLGTMDDVKTNFFTALTSTAWGIIFSVLFKILNSFFAYHIETQIEESKKIEEMIGPKRSKKSR